MSVDSYIVGGAQPPTHLNSSDSLKSGPTPREVEVLERWHRDRVHTQRGNPHQAHRIEQENKSRAKNNGAAPGRAGSSIGLDLRV
jgi:hypothetical protein